MIPSLKKVDTETHPHLGYLPLIYHKSRFFASINFDTMIKNTVSTFFDTMTPHFLTSLYCFLLYVIKINIYATKLLIYH